MAAPTLSPIPKLEKLSRRVFRVLGCNPGPKTLRGTNTYLIGTGRQKILLDTGSSGYSEYLENLKKSLHDDGIKISEILISHWHPDHIGGISGILSACKNYLSSDTLRISKHKSQNHDDESDQKNGNFSYNFVNSGTKFSTEGASLTALYTPGHSDDHLIFVLEEEGAVFSGDCILGEGTSVFEDLHDYMKSLESILSLSPKIIYPGHGPVIVNPVDKIKFYIEHRNQREQQIDAVLKKENDGLTVMDIVKIIYVDTPNNLFEAAAGNVYLHLGKLRKEGKVSEVEKDDGNVVWKWNAAKL